MKKYKYGVIIGKFYPLHKGHEYLIRTGIENCDLLTVLVCTLERETIPGKLRHIWVKETFPECRVIHVSDDLPQYPEEHPDFWSIWKSVIIKNHPEKIECILSSEEYGNTLSEILDCIHLQVDPERKNFTVSGTMCRKDPIKYWDLLSVSARPYFLKRVVITGSESTGKTTLCRKLAEYFHTEWVPEYGRIYLENKGSEMEKSDLEIIGKGQAELEDRLSLSAEKVLICDTDLIITEMYSEWYYSFCPESVRKEIIRRKYDLHILLEPDVPWVKDGLRDFPDRRIEFRDELLRKLAEYGCRTVRVSGNYEDRFEKTVKLILDILSSKKE